MATAEPQNNSEGIPPWTHGQLPDPKPLRWRNWASFIGPGIVMMGIQIGGGEWLLGPAMTAKYGGGLMWIATVAILLQVFYNMECGRYALYCGEPVFTGSRRASQRPTAAQYLIRKIPIGGAITKSDEETAWQSVQGACA